MPYPPTSNPYILAKRKAVLLARNRRWRAKNPNKVLEANWVKKYSKYKNITVREARTELIELGLLQARPKTRQIQNDNKALQFKERDIT